MMRLISRMALLCTFAASLLVGEHTAAQEPAYLLVRSDDLGMSHAANEANRRLIEAGVPFSASVMAPTPWFTEAVALLGAHPEVAVGLHLTLNSEWEHLRWGPVLGATAVPSLVDSLGTFFPTWPTFWAEPPDYDEVERELRAQIERARTAGLSVEYLDAHMGMATANDTMRGITERLAAEYGLGLSGYFGERRAQGVLQALLDGRPDSLAAALARLEPGGVYLMVTHLGLETPEMQALNDHNPDGVRAVAARRQAELEALRDPAFRAALEENNVRLLTYRDLIEMRGRASMRRPGP